MPVKYEHVVFCSLLELQLQLYRLFISWPEIKKLLRGTGLQPLKAINILKKLCNPPQLPISPATSRSATTPYWRDALAPCGGRLALMHVQLRRRGQERSCQQGRAWRRVRVGRQVSRPRAVRLSYACARALRAYCAPAGSCTRS